MKQSLSSLPETAKAPLRAAFHTYAALVGGVRNRVGAGYQHLLICGFPRSGTSLLYNMLAATLPNYRFTEFEQRAVPLLQDAGNVASKTPMDIFEIDEMLADNPYRKQLHVVIPLRDPRDILTSRHPMLPDAYFIGYDFSWWPQKDGSWRYDAAGIGAIHSAIARVRDTYAAHTMLLRYESLLEDADAVQRTMADKLGLRFSGRFSQYHEQQQKLVYRYDGRHAARDGDLVLENKPVQQDRAGKWRDPKYARRIREQFMAFPALFDVLIELGYETDRRWFDGYADPLR